MIAGFILLRKQLTMITLLIATDFSSTASNAALYGMELAKALKARIILVNAYQQMPIPISATRLIVTAEDMRRDVLERLDREALFIGMGTGIEVETVCGEGSATMVISGVARKEKPDLILLGVKGDGKGVHKIFGSTVTTLARRMRFPLLAIPGEAKYVDLLSIGLADDIRPDTDPRVLDPLRLIAQRFHSKLYIVRIIEEKAKETAGAQDMPVYLRKMMGNLESVYEYRADQNIVHGLKDFMASRRLDMLVMLPHRHSLLARWLDESNTRSMTFETTVPLLMLPEVRHKEGESGIPLVD